MTFQSPAWLWALLALPVLAAGLLAWSRTTHAAVRAYADPRVMRVGPGPRSRRLRAGAAALALLAVAAGTVAMARPSVAAEHDQRRSAVVIALDVSRSMLKDDLAPTRLAAAVDAAERFASAAPKETAIGLVTFADRAQVALAPTTDREAVRRALEGIGEPREGTALGEAVTVALGSLQSYGALDPPPASPRDAAGRVLVLTDGANSIRRRVATPGEAATQAVAERVPVYTILLGDDPGRPDQPTPSETLAAMSARTGGIHAQTTTASDLRQVFADIGGIVAPVEELRELTVWLALAALVLLLAAAVAAGLAGVRDARRARAPAAGLSPPR